jgi:predicted DNA-binding ribbon-helix-helix protein
LLPGPRASGYGDKRGYLRSQVTKRSLVVGGHKTSVSLEDAFWIELRSIAHNLGVHLSQLVGSIDSEREHSNLSSTIRLFVFEYRNHASNGHALSPRAQAMLSGARRQVVAH